MLKRLFDDGLRELRKDLKIADKVLALEPEIQKLSDEELQAKTPYFKQLLSEGKTLDDILVEAYAVVREAAYRVTQKKPFKVQVAGAIAIHGGNIAEMKTGEGKTLTAVMPAYLNALDGKGVHIVTVNEYLAQRETTGEIGQLFKFLGLTVGLNIREKNEAQKREAYACDIMYSTNSELGFDYLRDNMAPRKENQVQRGLNYAIIDEVDSILVDEARTPLIISGQPQGKNELYYAADSFAKRLADEDYEIDLEAKTIDLLPSGIDKAERIFKLDNLYDIQNVELVHRINNALKANYLFAKGKEYVVDAGEVKIVDSFTGRILEGRQYSEGLHQAIEAKEKDSGVQIRMESVTVATITYQNFFRLYSKLSGMTGTAKTEEEEFVEIYNMYVVEVPTNVPVIREDRPDLLFVGLDAKWDALIDEVVRRHKIGQPILIGTVAVETSELISKRLKKAQVPHEVLNAKNHYREAEIIEKAGLQGAVTIATNMAGRGTDIKLGEGVVERGGLCVLGTERHEARRIDNQLRGRSGRQGDPGFSQFYTSTEDDLMIRFGGEKFQHTLERFVKMSNGGDMTKPVENKSLTKTVTRAQERVEGMNYDSRKNVLKYDNVIAEQREKFYEERNEILHRDNIDEIVWKMIASAIEKEVEEHITGYNRKGAIYDYFKITTTFNQVFFVPHSVDEAVLKTKDEDTIYDYLLDVAKNLFESKLKNYIDEVFKKRDLDEKQLLVKLQKISENNPKAADDFQKLTKIRSERTPESIEESKKKTIDSLRTQIFRRYTVNLLTRYWTTHIDKMSELRQGVSLKSYGQINPLQAYRQEGKALYDKMISDINRELTKYLIKQISFGIAETSQQDMRRNTIANDGKTPVAVKKKTVKVRRPHNRFR